MTIQCLLAVVSSLKPTLPRTQEIFARIMRSLSDEVQTK